MFGGGSTFHAVFGGGAFPAAVGWIDGVLFGSLGTSIAVIAVAGFGFAMLQGRLSTRQGLRIVIGCFILFGAPSIARGIAGLGGSGREPIVIPTPAPVPIQPGLLPDLHPPARPSSAAILCKSSASPDWRSRVA